MSPKYFYEFISHSQEFEPLTSTTSSEEIIDMKWLQPQDKYLKLLASSDKVIKLWRINEKNHRKVCKSAGQELNVPKIMDIKSETINTLQHCFTSRHQDLINNIAISYH